MSDLRSELWKRFLIGWGIVAVICFFPIIFAALWMTKHEGCGIPIYIWIIGYFAFALFFSSLLLLIPWFFSARNMRCLGIYAIFLILGYLWLQAMWCIYGHHLYFSDDNDC